MVRFLQLSDLHIRKNGKKENNVNLKSLLWKWMMLKRDECFSFYTKQELSDLCFINVINFQTRSTALFCNVKSKRVLGTCLFQL